eukprot:GHVN01083042.1.p1 GENE.GHVN01083042.1~~GHVN01083042.1.p1  ORF type:complete len:132 (+),score=21.42 GHVN01083042.1:306-701(+)
MGKWSSKRAMTRPKRSCQQKRPKRLSPKKNWNWTWDNYIVNGKPWIKKKEKRDNGWLPTLRETERRRGEETSPNKTRHQKNYITKDEGCMDKGADRKGVELRESEVCKELVTRSHHCLPDDTVDDQRAPWL